MAVPDPDIKQYLPAVHPRRNVFKSGLVYYDDKDDDKLFSLVKINEEGVSRKNTILTCGVSTELNVDFELRKEGASTSSSTSQSMHKSGLVFVKSMSLFTMPLAVNDEGSKPKVILLMEVSVCCDVSKITARKLKPCTALMVFQSGGCAKEIVLDFQPGTWLLPEDSDEDRLNSGGMLWFAVLRLDQLDPLPWAKFDKNWRSKDSARRGGKGTIQVIWIKEKQATILMTMLDQQKYTDFIINCSDKDVPCHRSVLAAASDTLDRLLTYKKSTGNFDFGKLFEADSTATMAFLKFIYSEFIDVSYLEASFKVTSTVLKIAVEYNIVNLVEKCANIIIKADEVQWFDGVTLYDLYGFVLLWTDLHQVMAALKLKVVKTLKKLLVEKRRRAREMDSSKIDDDVDFMLDFQELGDKNVFKEWLGDVLELDD